MGYWNGSTWTPEDPFSVAASMSRVSTQSVADVTTTKVQLSTSDLTLGGTYAPTIDAATNYTITIAKAGTYRVTAMTTCTTAAPVTGYATLYVYKGGLLTSMTTTMVMDATGSYPLWFSRLVALAAGDALDLRVYQNTGGAQNFERSQLDVQLLR